MLRTFSDGKEAGTRNQNVTRKCNHNARADKISRTARQGRFIGGVLGEASVESAIGSSLAGVETPHTFTGE